MFLELLRNLAILLALCMAYTLLFQSRDRSSLKGRLMMGVLFGVAAVWAILTPAALFPGVLIDGRAIFISMAGLFGGGLTALIASAMALICRAWLGGPGAPVGYAIVVTAALLGTGYRYLLRKQQPPISITRLYVFGLVVHLDMLLLLLALPDDIRWHVIETVALPILLIYPIGTVLIGRLLMIQDERTAVERARAESEQRLASILRAAPVGIGVVRDRILIEVNPYVCELTGYRREELVGQSARMLYPTNEEFLWVGEEKYRQIEERGTGTVETRWRSKDGRIIDVLLSSTPIKMGAQPLGTTFTVLDITERKRVQRALRESEERYRIIIENQTDLVVQVDPDGRFLFASPSYCRMFGKTEEELLGNRFMPLVHEEDRETTEEAMQALHVPPYEAYMEQRAKTKDGWRWLAWQDSAILDKHGNVTAIIGVGRDITDQKAAEDALIASEEKYRGLVESSSDWIWELDKDNKFSYASPQVKTILGYDPEELIGKSPLDLMAPEEAARIHEIFNNLHDQAGAIVRMENINLHRDGHEVVIETSGVPALNQAGELIGYRGVDRDITSRKRADEALRSSLQKLALHVEQTPLAVIGWDLDFHVSEWNPAAEQIFGYSREEAIGRHASFMIPDSVREQVDAIWDELIGNRGGTRGTNENTTKDGKTVLCEWYNTPLIDSSGKVIGAASQVMDITARKKSEEERDRLMLAIEQADEIMVITDADATIQYVNPAFERTTGYSREEVTGRNPRILQSGQHSAMFYQKMWRTLTAGQTWTGRLINKKKDGSTYTEDATISPVKDRNGKIVNYVAAKRDATHEIELENQLRHAQKMEAVGQMAGGIAHDFNNLLQVISGYVELSEMSLSPENELAPAIAQIGKAAQRGKGLINQLLAFSRRQVIKPQDLDLNDLIDPLLTMMRGLIGEHIELDFIKGRELGTVHADRGLLEQVMMNLCVNARDAMPTGGRLTIETENVLINGEYVRIHTWATPGRYVLLSITDTGCGMTPETLGRIFEPFFTTKEVGKGTGLGLSTVFGIIKQHNGHVNVYSEPDKGTIFKIYLPTVARKAGEVSREVTGRAVGGTETLLIAEDDEAVLALAKHLLTDAGYTVLTARDGEEAIEVFERNADKIDAVMFDVVMPRLGGKQAVERILELRPGLPHLFASGYSENAVHTNFIQKRGLHLLNKPYQTETLLRKIREVLDGK